MKKQSTNRQTLNIYWAYTNRYRTDFAVAAGGAVLAVIAQGMVPPYIISRIFNRLQHGYADHTALHFGDFLPYFLVFAASMTLGAAMWRIQSYFTWRLEVQIQRDMSNDIYNHLLSQSQRFHADRFGGALVSQTNKFVGAYERVMDDLIWSIVPGVTTLVVAVAILSFISYQYALVLIVISAFYLSVMSKRVIRQIPYNREQSERETEQTAALADSITNVDTIRAFAHELHEKERFYKATEATFKAYKKLSVEALKTDAISHAQTNGFQVIAVLAGLIAVTTYGLNAGLLYIIVSYTQRITEQLWLFSRIVRNANRSFGDAAQMTEILAVSPEIVERIPALPARMLRGEVVFKDVTFSYPENEPEALFRDLSMKIKPGEKVGLVGPSGGGKTTVTKLLLRFMDITSGVITIDGQNIADVSQSDLRSRIAYVSQEPILFHRTLAENIGYGDLTISRQAIEAAAKMAHAHEFIQKLPRGYETLVGERGVKLSGGQRQRVAIARAMLKNAPILVLDEATSALDSESEVLIQDALWRLMEGRTAIVIAHRLSTIQKMDRIIVLENGKISEQGSHRELLRNESTYAKLWSHQSGGFIDN